MKKMEGMARLTVALELSYREIGAMRGPCSAGLGTPQIPYKHHLLKALQRRSVYCDESCGQRRPARARGCHTWRRHGRMDGGLVSGESVTGKRAYNGG